MPESRITRITSICTMNPQTLSITPTAIAPADDIPTLPKKRISSAILAAELGTASATNWIPYCSITTGPNRTGLMQAPIVANACATPTVGESASASASQARSAFLN